MPQNISRTYPSATLPETLRFEGVEGQMEGFGCMVEHHCFRKRKSRIGGQTEQLPDSLDHSSHLVFKINA
ncbi:uncharacterized protein QC763_206657 [Podospora pseudopauciseta]|uniref:Uncharacterized protein n=1 Tax=Podospora pseudopauciseta TaxID=2093780 RepID=A0ABR0HP39_9PEZI|nr:hypothetical protein QC763_206657 [Podospora pseudopauciseta]